VNGNPLKLLDDWPVERPADWVQFVNEAAAQGELSMLRENVLRSRPLGDEPWVAAMAKRLGLEFTLRPRGRPKLKMDNQPQSQVASE
jgi:putative transposase